MAYATYATCEVFRDLGGLATAIVQPLEQDAKTPSRLREGVALT